MAGLRIIYPLSRKPDISLIVHDLQYYTPYSKHKLNLNQYYQAALAHNSRSATILLNLLWKLLLSVLQFILHPLDDIEVLEITPDKLANSDSISNLKESVPPCTNPERH
jgi:hypothetical protein